MRRLALILACVLIPTSLAGAVLASESTPRASTEVVDVSDKRGDVKFFAGAKGLTAQERKSIDLRRIRVVRRDDTVRFILTIKEITTSKKFDQIAVVLLSQRRESTGVSGNIGFSAQGQFVAPYAHLVDDGFDVVEECEPTNLKAQPRKRQFRVDVPFDCIPPGRLRIKVGTVTGKGYAGDGKPLYSRDAWTDFKSYRLLP
jgi:hypothetical protein